MHFFGVMQWLPFRSSVRSQVQIPRKEQGMRRYVITCEFYRGMHAAAAADCIRRLASEWEHPLEGVWIVATPLSAGEIRSALAAHLGFRDRVCICETGTDRAEFNTLAASGEKVTQIQDARANSRLLADIFSRNGQSSRHLKAATAKNLRSA